jgi:hypothetical protein
MALPSGRALLLFVAGEPSSGPDPMKDVETSVFRRVSGMMLGSGLVGRPKASSTRNRTPQSPSPEDALWHLPPEEIQCVKMVLLIAQKRGRSVTVVDVNRDEGHQVLIARWVGADDVLPLLVRPDGTRLEGLEDFTPSQVRRFIRES